MTPFLTHASIYLTLGILFITFTIKQYQWPKKVYIGGGLELGAMTETGNKMHFMWRFMKRATLAGILVAVLFNPVAGIITFLTLVVLWWIAKVTSSGNYFYNFRMKNLHKRTFTPGSLKSNWKELLPL